MPDRLKTPTDFPNSKSSHTWTYYALHGALNSAGKRWFKKTAINPNPDSLSSKILPDEMRTNVNYPEVPYIHQPRVNDCVDSSIGMMLQFHEKKCAAAVESPELTKEMLREFRDNFDRRREKVLWGKSISDIRKYSDALSDIKMDKGLIEAEDIADYLYKYGPLVAFVKIDVGPHAMVIKGVVDNKVIFHDPWKGPDKVWDFEKFKRKWHGDLVYIEGGYSKKSETMKKLPLRFCLK